jgi:hypothetical protein
MLITQLFVYLLSSWFKYMQSLQVGSLQTLFSKYKNWKKYIQIVRQWGTLL